MPMPAPRTTIATDDSMRPVDVSIRDSRYIPTVATAMPVTGHTL
jgi:hypothetical protein